MEALEEYIAKHLKFATLMIPLTKVRCCPILKKLEDLVDEETSKLKIAQ